MAVKTNPLLAAFEAKLEADYQARLARHAEFERIAWLISGSDLGFVAQKRADDLLTHKEEIKIQLAKDLLEDAKADKTCTYTRADVARRIKEILGPEAWKRHQHLFPMLRDYWEV